MEDPAIGMIECFCVPDNESMQHDHGAIYDLLSVRIIYYHINRLLASRFYFLCEIFIF